MRAKYDGTCRECRNPIGAGDKIFWSKATGSLCHRCGGRSTPDVEPDVEAQLQRADEREYQVGVARGEHIRFTAAYFGEEAAAAEELAWSLKDPDPNY